METEQYFKCPVCDKKVLKSKGVLLMYTTICKECYKKMRDSEIKVNEDGN